VTLARDLDAAVARLIDTPPTPILRAATPKDFQPGIRYDQRTGIPLEITTSAQHDELGPEDWAGVVAKMGVRLPPGYRLVIDECRFDPAAWHRDEQGEDAVTRPIWRYRFKVVPAALVGGEDEDLEKLQKAARRAVRSQPRSALFDKVSMVVVLGDIQAGKVDRRGGTAELLERLEYAKQEVLKRVRRIKPHQIVVIDGGDAMEMFESSPGADRTNDLQQTEQIRIWRRIFWDWVSSLSGLAAEVDVISVPSNHCSVRRGKQNMGPSNDDYGLEVLSQLSDMAATNPAAYGHVKFWAPSQHEEAVALTLIGGKTLGVIHGHQFKRPEGARAYMAGQALGRTAFGSCDIAVVNHYHTFWVQSVGDDRWMIGSPTMDAGSSWFANMSGTESAPGVLSFVVDERGWRDLHIAWARVGVDYEVLS
jgi:hypothetical protein